MPQQNNQCLKCRIPGHDHGDAMFIRRFDHLVVLK